MHFNRTKNILSDPVTHSIVWGIYFSYDILSSLAFDKELKIHPLQIVVNISFVLVAFYWFAFRFFPLVSQGKWKNLSIEVPVFLITYMLVKNFALRHLLVDYPYDREYQFLIAESWRMIHFGLYAFGYWYFKTAVYTQINLLEKEIQIWKNQLSPHFLLSMLTSLYGNSLKNPKSINKGLLKLAKLLRYSLVFCEKNTTLAKETKKVQDYLKLQELRYRGRLFVSFKNDLDKEKTKSVTFPAMVLVTLVDNIFQHGIFSDEDMPATIHFFHLRDKDPKDQDTLVFKFINSFSSKNIQSDSVGIGLENAERILYHHFAGKINFTKKIDIVNCVFILQIEIKYETSDQNRID